MLAFLRVTILALAGLSLAQDVGICQVGADSSPCNGNGSGAFNPQVPKNPGKPQCTKTLTHTSVECCGTIAGHTVTSYTNCKGCVADYEPTPLCRCFAPPPTDMALTSTWTACWAAKTPSMSTFSVGPRETGDAGKCTTTLEVDAKGGGCGDCGHTYAKTAFVEVDCKGCEVAVKTKEAGGFGICACPTTTETTVTACRGTPTGH